ncbi:MAG: endonuclease [Thermoplasmata archaeon]|nr:endonuclease [Thermoplasmata archaeon]
MAIPRGGKARGPAALARLEREYGPRYSFLDHGSDFQLLVAVILSAQTPDALVNKVTPALFKRWPTPQKLAKADPDDVLAAIRRVNFSHGKSQRIVACAQKLLDEFGGQVPRDLDALTSLPGVGRKTANVVQGHLFGASTGVGVDTHVKRVSFRLGLTDQTEPEDVERDLNRVFAPADYPDVNFCLIAHGRAICRAPRPKCPDCLLADLCPKKGVNPKDVVRAA